MGRSLPSAVAIVALLGALTGCAGDPAEPAEPASEGSTRPGSSYSAFTVPPKPLSGRLEAEVLQYSRDAARGRIQVWLRNGTEDDVEPVRIRYVDPRLVAPIVAQRLRAVPSGLDRGYPLPLPEPRCGPVPDRDPVAIVETAAGQERLSVDDRVDIVQQYVDARCFERAVQRLVDLRWDDAVPATDGVGRLTLVAAPTGRPGRVELLSVGGTPVMSAPPGQRWRLRRVLVGAGAVRRIVLPMTPNRCDSHAFFESGGATAFRLRLRVDGHVGEFVLRMSPVGAEAAFAYALGACGLDG